MWQLTRRPPTRSRGRPPRLALALAAALATLAGPAGAHGVGTADLGASLDPGAWAVRAAVSPRSSAGPGRLQDAEARDTSSAAGVAAYLLTMGPGELVWEKFGHNALLFHDPSTGRADVYNWGIFSFEQQDFALRLLFGHMRYMVARTTLDRTVRAYRASNRTIWARPLRLTASQVRELERSARIAARPENRFYDYDPFLDNCSSRARDFLDRILDGRIRAATDTIATGTTFRSHTRRLLQQVDWAYAAIMVMLGQGTDRSLTAWDEMFLPIRMDERLTSVTVDRDGEAVPLVGRADTLFRADRPPVPDAGPGFHGVAAAAGVGAGGLLVLLAWLAGTGRRGPAHAFAWLGAALSLAAGLLGLTIVGAWTLTDHWYAHLNENLLQLEPLSLALVVLLPLSTLTGRGLRVTRRVAWVVAGLAALGAILQLLPGFDQVNGEIVAVSLPIHVGIVVGLESITKLDEVLESERPKASLEEGGRAP